MWGWFVGLLEQALFQLSMFTGNPGFGIILFTLGVRLVMMPLFIQSLRSSRKLQQIQPQLTELRRKHGKDQQKLAEETMKLYQQYKINPAGGCLPLLIQLPIFIGVWQAINHLMTPSQQQFLGASVKAALENPATRAVFEQPFLSLNLGLQAWMTVPPGGELPPGVSAGLQPLPYLVLPVLAVILQTLQTFMSMPRVMDPQQKTMMQAMMVLPLVMGYVNFIVPVGAVLYWATSSFIGILQQYLVGGWGSLSNYLKFLPPDPPRWSPLAPPPHLAAAAALPAAGVAPEADSPAPAKAAFWDVMRPLTEQPAAGAAASGADDAGDQATEAELADVRRQLRVASNPRRPRRRR